MTRTAYAGLLTSTLIVVAAVTTTRAQRPALVTSGSLALYASRPDPGFPDVLRASLTDPDPGVRAVGARIVAIANQVNLGASLAAALDHEQDRGVAKEQIQSAILLNTPETLAAAREALKQAAPDVVAAYADALARSRPETFAQELPALWDLVPKHEGFLMGAIINATTRDPALVRSLADVVFQHLPAEKWSALTSLGPGRATNSLVGQAIIADGLASADPAIREAAVWKVVSSIQNSDPVPPDSIELALPRLSTAGPAALTWEQFGRELIARTVRQQTTPDRSDWLRTEAGRHSSDADALGGLGVLQHDELEALRTALGEKFEVNDKPSSSAMPSGLPKQPSMRVAEPPWPGFLASLLAAAGCRTSSSQQYGAMQVRFKADGRPSAVTIDTRAAPQPGCQAALAGLARVTLSDSAWPTVEGDQQLVLMPIERHLLACVDAPSTTVTMDPRPTTFVPPKRTGTVAPIYPHNERYNGIQGTVVMQSVVTARGCVRAAAVIGSVNQTLDFAAMLAAMQWRFKPALIDDKPIDVVITQYVNFSLH